jgi:acetyltransferase-like isoleucine patch superfamily enzyme
MFKNDDRNQSLRNSILKQFVSGVMTDDERAEMWGLPKGCRMRENAKIISPENFKCGEYVWIGEGAILDASGSLSIGSHSTVGSYVMVWSHTSYLANLAYENTIGSELISRRATKIGKGCYIVGHSVVYPGVSIGDQSVILPGSVVTEDIPGNCMVGGVPAKIIKKLPAEEIDRLISQERKKKYGDS